MGRTAWLVARNPQQSGPKSAEQAQAVFPFSSLSPVAGMFTARGALSYLVTWCHHNAASNGALREVCSMKTGMAPLKRERGGGRANSFSSSPLPARCCFRFRDDTVKMLDHVHICIIKASTASTRALDVPVTYIRGQGRRLRSPTPFLSLKNGPSSSYIQFNAFKLHYMSSWCVTNVF